MSRPTPKSNNEWNSEATFQKKGERKKREKRRKLWCCHKKKLYTFIPLLSDSCFSVYGHYGKMDVMTNRKMDPTLGHQSQEDNY